jgi:hypothetical protein
LHLSQDGQEATFHIDHITPIAAGGRTVAENLALARVSCSLRKGRARLQLIQTQAMKFCYTIRDATSGPRISHGKECVMIGLTPTGRATVNALDLNRPLILAIREEEAALGRHRD